MILCPASLYSALPAGLLIRSRPTSLWKPGSSSSTFRPELREQRARRVERDQPVTERVDLHKRHGHSRRLRHRVEAFRREELTAPE